MTEYSEELKKVRALAKIVRIAVEHLAKHEDEDDPNDCCNYNDSATLGGYCARASALLSLALEQAGIEHKIAGGNGHIFIKWRSRIVDVTATQFSPKLGKTVICTKAALDKRMAIHRRGFCKEPCTFDDRHELRDWQQKNNWPDPQLSSQKDEYFLLKLKEYKEYCRGVQK